MRLFLSLKHLRGHCRVINCPNFSIVVSQEIGRPKERKRDGGMACWWSSQNTHLSVKFSVLYGCGLWHL